MHMMNAFLITVINFIKLTRIIIKRMMIEKGLFVSEKVCVCL